MKKKIYRSVFEVIILSEFELAIEETTKLISDSLPDLPDEYYCTQTNALVENRELVGKTAVIEIERHAQELSDFHIDTQGNDTSDETEYNLERDGY